MKVLAAMMFCTLSLSTYANSYFHPKWSPDGSKIAFYGYVNNVPDIFILDIHSNEVKQITRTSDNWEIEPRWLDNQTLIIASGANMRKIRLTTLSINSANQQPMTGHVEMEGFVAKIPQSQDYLMNWHKDQHWNLYQMSPDGTKYQRLTQQDDIFTHQAFWEEKRLLASYQDNVVLLNLEGEIVSYLVKNKQKSSHPNMSSDMTKLLYVSTQDGQSDIFMLNLQSNETKQLTSDGQAKYAPQFSPNNEYFVYAGVVGGRLDILSMNLQGQLIKNLTALSH